MEGDRVVVQDHTVPCTISIHSLRMEGDSVYGTCFKLSRYFNPLPPHGGRRGGQTKTVRREGISIHSLRMEGDILPAVVAVPEDSSFQSTPSAWRETRGVRKLMSINLISIHSLRMEGDFLCSVTVRLLSSFQSTPSAWRETFPWASTFCSSMSFQSTPSAWRETQGERHSGQCGHISIHSLRMEGDFPGQAPFVPQCHFNPLPPHGGRPPEFREAQKQLQFQSTPSAWRETSGFSDRRDQRAISIHSLRMEGDRCDL